MVDLANGFDELWERIPEHRKRSAERFKQITLNDLDVRDFLTKYNKTNDFEFIQRNLLRFSEFIKTRDTDRQYTARLELRNNNVTVMYYLRTAELEFRVKNGFRKPQVVYDKTTRPFEKAEFNQKYYGMHNAEAVQYLNEFADNYRAGKASKGAWICGGMGIGKSYLTATFAKKMANKGANVRFYSANQLINDCYDSMNYNGANLQAKVDDIKERSEILIIDDLGTERITDWSLKQVIYQIFDYRMNNGMPTFATSNLTIDDYIEQVKRGRDVNPADAKRLGERLKTLMKQIQMGGPNLRDKD